MRRRASLSRHWAVSSFFELFSQSIDILSLEDVNKTFFFPPNVFLFPTFLSERLFFVTVKANECLKTEVAASQHKANMFDFLLFFFMKKSSSLIFPSSHSFTVALSIGQLSLHRVLGFSALLFRILFPLFRPLGNSRERERQNGGDLFFQHGQSPTIKTAAF